MFNVRHRLADGLRAVLNSTSSFTAAGSESRNCGSSFLMSSTTCTVFAPGWRWMDSNTARSLLNHAPPLSFCTLSSTLPNCSSRTGLPLRYATIIGRNAAASLSWPLAWRVNDW